MRYGGEHKAETRSRIVAAAARLVREKGPANAAVTDVMAEAGLTHGGFYAHFGSKDGLIAEAVDQMFIDGRLRAPALDEALSDTTLDPHAAFRTYLTSYLSPRHRDEPDRGCPLPALSADMARHRGPARARFADGLEKLTAAVEAVVVRLGMDDPRVEAEAIVAQMVGAVALARAVGAGAQSDAILHDNLAAILGRIDR